MLIQLIDVKGLNDRILDEFDYKENSKIYREQHKEKISQYGKIYQQQNKEKISQRKKEKRKQDKEQNNN